MLLLSLICLILCSLTSQINAEQPFKVKVDGKLGRDTSDCLVWTGPPCKTLQFVVNRFYKTNHSNNAEAIITIVSSELALHSNITLTNVNNFIIEGIDTMNTTIVCRLENVAGIYFVKSSDIILRNFRMTNCTGGLMTANDFYTINQSHQAHRSDDLSSIALVECTNVDITNVQIFGSYGNGISLMNSNGYISVQDCTISNVVYERIHVYKGGAHGIYVSVNDSVSNHSATYMFERCVLLNNYANLKVRKWESNDNHGGGLHVIFAQGADHNEMCISDCIFKGNKAKLGAATNFAFENCINNSVKIYNSQFMYNKANYGGGAADIVFKYSVIPLINNSLEFNGCHFSDNTAKFAGGVAIHVSPEYVHEQSSGNVVAFNGCQFNRNIANGGAAVDMDCSVALLNVYAFVSFFKNCSFANNTNLQYTNRNQSKFQSGVFFTLNMQAYFEGQIIFHDNIGTALYVIKTNIILKNTTMMFINNSDSKGAAVLLIGEASLQLNQNNHLVFTNNTASYGGAICAEELPLHNMQSCFITMSKKDFGSNTFKFSGNFATTGIGHDVFVSNLDSCTKLYNCSRPDELFTGECLDVVFTFSNVSDGELIATGIANLTVLNETLRVFPGQSFSVELLQLDQFGNDVSRITPAFANIDPLMNNVGTKISMKEGHRLIQNKRTTIIGERGIEGRLRIHTETVGILKVQILVETKQCPPGFLYHDNNMECICSVTQYVASCIDDVALRANFWTGYLNKSNSSSYQAIGNCDYRLCTYHDKSDYILPLDSKELESKICAPTRRGMLCGLCQENHTVYYHSPKFTCGKETSACTYGIVLYIISEIIPVSVVFIVIIFFDIHLTSGWLYTFIFYAQAVDILGLDAFGTVKHTGFTKTFQKICKTFYGIFNLNAFNLESISFCMFRNMNILDTYLIQYATILYCLLLIVVTLVALKIHAKYNCSHRCEVQGSVINGVGAFLILCYFKCIEITYHTNVPIYLYTIDKDREHIKTVVMFNGEYDYLKGGHKKYAYPCIVIFFLVILPLPTLLILESILLKINKISIIERHSSSIRFLRFRLKVLPFLDSFQGCFKDNCRCFAGFYFLYRIVWIPSNLLALNIAQVYIAVEMGLFVILLLHLIFQPYQNHWHNKIDIFLLTNLLVVNFITINQYYRTTLYYWNTSTLLVIQAVCNALPIIYVITYASFRISFRYGIIKKIQRRKNKVQRKTSRDSKTSESYTHLQ